MHVSGTFPCKTVPLLWRLGFRESITGGHTISIGLVEIISLWWTTAVLGRYILSNFPGILAGCERGSRLFVVPSSLNFLALFCLSIIFSLSHCDLHVKKPARCCIAVLFMLPSTFCYRTVAFKLLSFLDLMSTSAFPFWQRSSIGLNIVLTICLLHRTLFAFPSGTLVSCRFHCVLIWQ